MCWSASLTWENSYYEKTAIALAEEALLVMRILNGIDRFRVVFDDESLVAAAGLLVAGTLMKRLGLEGLLDETVRLGDRPGEPVREGKSCLWWLRC